MSEHHLRDEAAHLASEVKHEAEHEVEGTAALLTAKEQPSMIEAMGGPLGVTESALPSAAFVAAITIGAEDRTAGIIAVGIALVLTIARVARRQTPQFAIMGVIGVVISAWIASKTGEARNFFLPSFILNVVYGGLAVGSVAIGRPFIGYLVTGFGDDSWRQDPLRMRPYRIASLLWGGIFFGRLVVQLPLYWTDSLVALGTAKIAMGVPLFGLGVYLTWLLLRSNSALPSQSQTPPPAAG
ncbi:MAG: DUF3159 domain-containing protein [Patulibacter minatonensis]